jgi:hypothetical protein
LRDALGIGEKGGHGEPLASIRRANTDFASAPAMRFPMAVRLRFRMAPVAPVMGMPDSSSARSELVAV